MRPRFWRVAVDAEHLAERPGVDELLQLLHAGVVEQQVAGHEDEVALRCQRDELVDLGALHGGRLLDEDVLALRAPPSRARSASGPALRSRPRRARGRRASPRTSRPSRAWVAGSNSACFPFAGSQSHVSSARSAKFRARFFPHSPSPAWPMRWLSFQTLSERLPFAPVALRRSTTNTARRRARRSRSRSGS